MSKNMAVLDKNNKVINIIVASNDAEENNSLITYTDNNPAFIGGDYVNGYFYPEQPYVSWLRVEGKWQAPTPMPTTEGIRYYWSEDDLSWREITND